MGTWKRMTGVERVGLAYAWCASEPCVFRGTQLGTLIHESCFYVTVRLDYALAL
jgi:hypothetical protein